MDNQLIENYANTIFVFALIWIVFVIGLTIFLLFKFTFKEWTEENPNPYKGDTLGIPRGFFRSIISLTLLFIVILLEIVNLVNPGMETYMAEFLTAFEMMIAFYFGSKVVHHITSSERDQQKYIATALTEKSKSNNLPVEKPTFEDAEAQG